MACGVALASMKSNAPCWILFWTSAMAPPISASIRSAYALRTPSTAELHDGLRTRTIDLPGW